LVGSRSASVGSGKSALQAKQDFARVNMRER
jgi:hypothetical protein